ncbi:MAG: DUF4236 domain-containing protein [Dehalococcoidia bacterium]|nr:DUF4236 domain-containing protein [Dehalococcoidia bacterium]
MAMRFRRSVKLGPGMRLNLGKKSASVRLGGRGYGYTVSTSGRRTKSIGVPGSGLYWSSTSSRGKARGSTRADSGGSASIESSPTPRTIEQAVPKAGLFASRADKEFRSGVVAYASGRMEEARERFTACLAFDSSRISASLFRAFALAKLDRGADAIPDLERVIASDAQLPDKAMRKFLTVLDMRVELVVVPALKVPVAHDYLGAALLLAEVYQTVGRIEDAIDLLEGLGEAGADEVLVSCSLAELYGEAERWDDVIRVTDGLQNEDDMSLASLIFRSVALREMGLLDAAQEVHKTTLRSSKRGDELLRNARYERALTYERQGNRRMYKKDLETIFAAAPDYGDVRARLEV